MTKVKDTLWKLRILFRVFLPDTLHQWQHEIWCKDPDTRFCCDGNPMECGCQGVTTREVYDDIQKRVVTK